MTLLSFGEILYDVYVDDNKAAIGGAPFNLARYYAMSGGKSYIMSAVGRDELGRNAFDYCDKYKIKSDFLLYSDYPTGTVEVRLDANKVPSYVFKENTAYHNISPEEKTLDELKSSDADILAFGTLIQTSRANRTSLDKLIGLKNWKEIFCDINIRKAGKKREYVEKCLTSATILKFSAEEETVFSELGIIAGIDSIAELAEKYANLKIILRTKGEKGSEGWLRGDGIYSCPAAKPDKIVTTVGAGDSFGAAFLKAYASGAAMNDCLKAAAETSACVISGNINN